MSSAYIHGTDPEEQKRLSTLNVFMNDASLRELSLQGGERILDVGSGLGQLARAMARCSRTRPLGIERSAEQLTEAIRLARDAGEEHLVEFRQGDALNLPLTETEWGSFDIAHTRFVLEHVSDPLCVVQAMVKAVRVGGRIILQDDDHDILRIWPEPPGFQDLWNAYIAGYERLGSDPYVGRKLVSLLHQSGATPVRITSIPFGSCAGTPSFPIYIDNLVSLLFDARDSTIESNRMSESAFDDAIANLRKWSERPDSAIWFSLAWAEGIRR